jgi:hypothetical protein
VIGEKRLVAACPVRSAGSISLGSLIVRGWTAALVVQKRSFEVIGRGGVAIYDNQPHPGAWYYWLKPGDRFDLAAGQDRYGSVDRY